MILGIEGAIEQKESDGVEHGIDYLWRVTEQPLSPILSCFCNDVRRELVTSWGEWLAEQSRAIIGHTAEHMMGYHATEPEGPDEAIVELAAAIMDFEVRVAGELPTFEEAVTAAECGPIFEMMRRMDMLKMEDGHFRHTKTYQNPPRIEAEYLPNILLLHGFRIVE